MRNENFIGYHGGCGGLIRVSDFRTHDRWRYEAYCEKCLSCDCNGYGNIKDTVKGASRYFHVTPSPTPSEQATAKPEGR